MRNQQKEIFDLMEKLFDAKLDPIKVDICDIKKALFGNGKKGITDRIKSLELWRVYIAGGFVVISTLFVIFMNEIKGFIFRK